MLRSFWLLFKRKYPVIAFWGVILAVLLVNSQYISYPDEFDNILGGKLILHGILPYRGFFSHHGALGYFSSAILVAFGGISFVHFRFLTAIFYFLLFILSAYVLSKRVSKFDISYFFSFLTLLVVAATYFWGQVFLADTVSGYFLILPYALLTLKIYFQEKLENIDLWILSLFSAAAVLMSTTYLYAGIVLGAVSLIYFAKDYVSDLRKGAWPLARFLGIFLVPYAFFLGYLLITGSMNDFLFQAVSYNEKYYIYNYPRPAGSTAFNPLRYAVVIFNDFFNNFYISASGLLGFYPRSPLTHLFSLANIALWFWLLIKKRYLLFLFGLLFIVYVSARGNPAQISATDYQTAVYFMLSLLNVFLVLFFLRMGLDRSLDRISAALMTIVGVALIIFTFFGGMFLSLELWHNAYNRFMGTYPYIYDRPVVAPILNKIVPADHYCWVGPFEFEEMFYANCKLPSKYHWILPQFGGITEIKKEILADYSSKLPDVIVYRRDFSAFGQSAEFSNFFVDFLNLKYVRLKDVDKEKKYRFVSSREKDFNFDDDFNFEKSQALMLVQKLVEEGYVNGK